MMRRLFMTIFVVATTTLIWAEPISREQALRQAQQFFLQKGKSKALEQAETSMSKARARGLQIPDYYYVFNAGQNEGFVIISGDDRAVTVLGYSDKGSFDADQIPSNMAAWLKGYEAQIKALRENRISVGKKTNSKASPSVAPIVQVHWDQNSPYNKYCLLDLPVLKKPIQAPTGCVATAMAQVMSVYKYPSATTNEIPAYEVNFGSSGIASYDAIAANTPIDWDNLDVVNYNGSEEEAKKEAIANLMSYCGRSVEMVYNGTGSSASVSDVANALKTYFGYGKQTAYKRREWSNDKDWNLMIYNEVASGHPVIYGGQTGESKDSEGHAFIVDGYDEGGDAFHINWGWGQLPVSPDGYYKLSALDPIVEGTGGSSGAYNFVQEAVIGIDSESTGEAEKVIATVVDAIFDEPGTAISTAIQNANTEKEYTRNAKNGYVMLSLYFRFQNRLANVYNFDFGMGLYKDGSLIEDIVSVGSKNDMGNLTTYTTGWSTTPYGNGLANGSYEIKTYSKETGSPKEKWRLCENADMQTIYLTVTDDKIVFYKSSAEMKDGDANGDGEVNVADVDYVIESIGEDIETHKAADVNGDGEINVADVDYIIERIV